MMIKRFIPDFFFILAAFSAVFIFAVLLPRDLKTVPPVTLKEKPAVVEPNDAPAAKVINDNEGEAIRKRNIFTASGIYGDTESKAETAYELIGIVNNDEMKALFRESGGAVIKAGRGKKLADGFRIKSVDNGHVRLRKGGEEKEYCLFAPAGSSGAIISKSKSFPTKTLYLTGILDGTIKKALFRDDSGALSVWGIKSSLPDGSVINRINANSVIVQKGKMQKELKIHMTALPLPQEPPVQKVETPPVVAKRPARPPVSERRPKPQAKAARETELEDGK